LSPPIQLIVGLANPGTKYEYTRHNAGAWLIQTIATQNNTKLQPNTKFQGLYAKIELEGQPIHLLIPTTYMNLSGQSVKKITEYYKIPIEQTLIAHDEIDFPPSTAKFKQGGGHGGHNGLRDIINHFNQNKNFHRIRIGIGHPGDKNQVTDYVLSPPIKTDKIEIEASIEKIIKELPNYLKGNHQQAMNNLHKP